MLSTNLTAQAIDDALAGTFPASDPPAWTPGMARPAPMIARRAADTVPSQDDTSALHSSGVMDVSRASHPKPTFAQALASLIGAASLALLLPFAMLAVGTAVALGVRGLLEAATWFLAIIR